MDYTKLYQKYSKDDNLRKFFIDPKYAHLYHISYNELIYILGDDVSGSALKDYRKDLYRLHFLMNSASYDALWKYKYVPLGLHCLYCLSTLSI